MRTVSIGSVCWPHEEQLCSAMLRSRNVLASEKLGGDLIPLRAAICTQTAPRRRAAVRTRIATATGPRRQLHIKISKLIHLNTSLGAQFVYELGNRLDQQFVHESMIGTGGAVLSQRVSPLPDTSTPEISDSRPTPATVAEALRTESVAQRDHRVDRSGISMHARRAFGGPACLATLRFGTPTMASKRLPYRSLQVDGYELLVGLRPQDNDTLTFQVAKPTDEFFRASGSHDGSHVILRNPTGEPLPRAVLEKAAAVAAWYSPFRNEERVEVHHCRVRNVRKKPGSAPGEIRVYGFKKKFVAPRLEETEEPPLGSSEQVAQPSSQPPDPPASQSTFEPT